jgi:hypothetical protein
MASEDNAPRDDDPRLPDMGSHLLQKEVAWNFKDDVADLIHALVSATAIVD